MASGRGRARPSSPAEIQERAAQARAAARAAERDPASWGVNAEVLQLPTAGDVAARSNDRGRVVTAKRSDPFDLLLAGGGLSFEQHRAARRLMRDWCIAAGVRDAPRPDVGPVDGDGLVGPQEVTQAMIDAGRRRDIALAAAGPVSGRVLKALMTGLVDECRIIAWRGVVQRETGETDKNVQGAMVRQACENLRLHYDALRAHHEAQPPLELRPFNALGGGAAA
jgi:hypothetical protein